MKTTHILNKIMIRLCEIPFDDQAVAILIPRAALHQPRSTGLRQLLFMTIASSMLPPLRRHKPRARHHGGTARAGQNEKVWWEAAKEVSGQEAGPDVHAAVGLPHWTSAARKASIRPVHAFSM